MKFTKLTDNNKFLRNDFIRIHYHLRKISTKISECEILAPFDSHLLYGCTDCNCNDSLKEIRIIVNHEICLITTHDHIHVSMQSLTKYS